jgi:hypothetical protein
MPERYGFILDSPPQAKDPEYVDGEGLQEGLLI